MRRHRDLLLLRGEALLFQGVPSLLFPLPLRLDRLLPPPLLHNLLRAHEHVLLTKTDVQRLDTVILLDEVLARARFPFHE